MIDWSQTMESSSHGNWERTLTVGTPVGVSKALSSLVPKSSAGGSNSPWYGACPGASLRRVTSSASTCAPSNPLRSGACCARCQLYARLPLSVCRKAAHKQPTAYTPESADCDLKDADGKVLVEAGVLGHQVHAPHELVVLPHHLQARRPFPHETLSYSAHGGPRRDAASSRTRFPLCLCCIPRGCRVRR